MNQDQITELRRQLETALQLHGEGASREARKLYDSVAGKAAANNQLHSALGDYCSTIGLHEFAVRHYRIVLSQQPNNARIMALLGTALLRSKDIQNAHLLLSQAQELEPQCPEAHYGLGLLNLERTDLDSARNHFEKTLRLAPEHIECLISLANLSAALNDYGTAQEYIQQARDLNPANADALAVAGRLLAESGQTEEAIAYFETMIAGKTNLALAYTNLARLKRYSAEDQAFIDQAKRTLQGELSKKDTLAINFALGKMLDDMAAYDDAFAYFRQANELQKDDYTIAADRSWYELITSNFTAESIAELAALAPNTAQPVFIVGMPRSGTTLMERLIASHSKGAGAGELLALPRIAHTVLDEDGARAHGELQSKLTASHAADYQQQYLNELQRGQQPGARIVDKLPGNYQNLGLINILFPKATIIHAIRNPLDTCLSCYFQAFGQVRWSNDFKTIAATYKLYRDYMDHWDAVLPEGKILHVHYENLVQNPEIEGKRMLEHCGLVWEDQCLQFHEQKAIVKTVSHWQVRQPIYQHSRLRWLNYAKHVDELANSLSEFLTEERELLAEKGIQLKRKKRFGLF